MTDQDFDLTGANAHFEAAIQLDKPVGDVVLQSHLTIEDNIEQLSFVNGILREDDGLNVLRFDPGVTTGCNGGNNNSYASGQVQKHGAGNVMLPMGDGGVFAPAGIQAMIWMDQLQLLVKVILTVMRSATPRTCLTSLSCLEHRVRMSDVGCQTCHVRCPPDFRHVFYLWGLNLKVMKENWFAILMFSIVFGLLGFLLGRTTCDCCHQGHHCSHHQECCEGYGHGGECCSSHEIHGHEGEMVIIKEMAGDGMDEEIQVTITSLEDSDFVGDTTIVVGDAVINMTKSDNGDVEVNVEVEKSSGDDE